MMMMMMTSPPYQVIRLQSHDSQLLGGLDRLYRAFAIKDGHVSPPEQVMGNIVSRLDDETMLLIMAVTHEQPIGYALVFDVIEHPFIPDWQRSGYITQMFVQSGYRRQGVGQLLLDYSLDWLTQRGVPQLMLNVHVDNDLAERFWRKQGFTPYLRRLKRTLSP